MANPTTARTGGKPIRILLVEDNPGDVYLLEKALQHQQINYELIGFQDGEQAMRALVDDTCLVPDLILLDLKLPRREGFEVLRAIRGKPNFVGVPVGIFTSSDGAGDRHRAALNGAERYIHKPPTLEEFIDKVGGAVADMLLRR
jgi:DNA-binding response OmpR family regulator